MAAMPEQCALRPEDVADELGLSPTQIRNLMRMGRFKPAIGYVIKTKGNRMSYQIYRPMLDEYLHKSGRPPDTGGEMELMREENRRLRELLQTREKEAEELRELLRLALPKEDK